MKRQIILIAALSLFTANCFAQSFNQSQLDWLNGCWSGTGLGGEVDECWVSSADNKFTGVFQMSKDGQQKFSEILMISELDGQFAYRVKHFDTSFIQWANDKGVGVTFPFVEMGDDFIQFEGLRYELIDGACHVTLDMKTDGEVHQVGFVFTKQ